MHITITPDGVPGSTATFALITDEASVSFECQLTKNGRVFVAWEVCTSPKTYTALKPGTYVFSVRGTDQAGNVSTVQNYKWTVSKGARTSKAPARLVQPKRA